MLRFVLGIIIIIISIIGIIIGAIGAKGNEDGAGLVVGGSIFGIILGIIIFFCSFIHTVPTGSTGIVTTFGKVENYTLDAGISFMAPWKKVINMDNRIQLARIDGESFSKDSQCVSFTYAVNYQIDKSNAQEIYKSIGTDYFNIVALPQVKESVKTVFSRYTAEELLTNRSKLSIEIAEILEPGLAMYNIKMGETSLEDFDFSDEFTNAVEAKQVATQNKLRVQTEQEQSLIEAEAAAERKRLEAQGIADAAIISAKADAEIAKIAADSAEYQGQKDAAIMNAIGLQLSKYPQLLQYYQVTNWNGKLPDTMLSDGTSSLFQLN